MGDCADCYSAGVSCNLSPKLLLYLGLGDASEDDVIVPKGSMLSPSGLLSDGNTWVNQWQHAGHLFASTKYAKLGLYVCRFFRNGVWSYVIIDDKLPFIRSGRIAVVPAASHAKDRWMHRLVMEVTPARSGPK